MIEKKAPEHFFTKKGELRQILDIRVLWERRHGQGARPDLLAEVSKEKFVNLIKKINNEWHKDTSEGRVVKVSHSNEPLYFDSSFTAKQSNTKRDRPTFYPVVCRDSLPYFPLRAVRFLRKGLGFQPYVHDAIRKELDKAIQKGVGFSRKSSGASNNKLVEQINKGVNGSQSMPLFFPFHAVEKVYNKQVLAKMVNNGVKIETIVELNKKPKYTIETLVELAEEKELNVKALKNLEELGFWDESNHRVHDAVQNMVEPVVP